MKQCEDKSTFAASCLDRRYSYVTCNFCQEGSLLYDYKDVATVVELVWSSSYSLSVSGI